MADLCMARVEVWLQEFRHSIGLVIHRLGICCRDTCEDLELEELIDPLGEICLEQLWEECAGDCVD